MYNAMKILIFAAAILVGAFLANHFGWVSIPWVDINTVPTHGDNANRSEQAAQQALGE